MAGVNIVLTGFMGTGKSTVGPLVAERLGFRFVDTDAVIEAEAGQPVAALFAERGEAAFREHEARVCEHLAWQPELVIATGGGALLRASTRRAFLAGGLVVCLRAPLAEIKRRVGSTPGRPLFGPGVETLYRARQPIYDSLPHQVQTTGRSPAEVAEEVVSLWTA